MLAPVGPAGEARHPPAEVELPPAVAAPLVAEAVPLAVALGRLVAIGLRRVAVLAHHVAIARQPVVGEPPGLGAARQGAHGAMPVGPATTTVVAVPAVQAVPAAAPADVMHRVAPRHPVAHAPTSARIGRSAAAAKAVPLVHRLAATAPVIGRTGLSVAVATAVRSALASVALTVLVPNAG